MKQNLPSIPPHLEGATCPTFCLNPAMLKSSPMPTWVCIQCHRPRSCSIALPQRAAWRSLAFGISSAVKNTVITWHMEGDVLSWTEDESRKHPSSRAACQLLQRTAMGSSCVLVSLRKGFTSFDNQGSWLSLRVAEGILVSANTLLWTVWGMDQSGWR